MNSLFCTISHHTCGLAYPWPKHWEYSIVLTDRYSTHWLTAVCYHWLAAVCSPWLAAVCYQWLAAVYCQWLTAVYCQWLSAVLVNELCQYAPRAVSRYEMNHRGRHPVGRSRQACGHLLVLRENITWDSERCGSKQTMSGWRADGLHWGRPLQHSSAVTTWHRADEPRDPTCGSCGGQCSARASDHLLCTDKH